MEATFDFLSVMPPAPVDLSREGDHEAEVELPEGTAVIEVQEAVSCFGRVLKVGNTLFLTRHQIDALIAGEAAGLFDFDAYAERLFAGPNPPASLEALLQCLESEIRASNQPSDK
jgi:hypothetical protein